MVSIVLLAVCTILGGIAAVWFFWDKIGPFFTVNWEAWKIHRKRKKRKGLLIHKAMYGSGNFRVDVTQVLNQRIINDTLSNIHVGNQLGGDPCPNIIKDVIVAYSINGIQQQITVPENCELNLPLQAKHNESQPDIT